MSKLNKTIVITGASSGIGEYGAKALAAEGATVLLVARRAEELARVQQEIEAAGGVAHAYAADLSDEASIRACCETLLAEHPVIDVLINNAGRSIRRSIRESTDRLHDFSRVMQLNYLGAIQMTLAMLPGMLERDSGQIINVTSYSTLVPVPRYAAYIGAKTGLEGATRSMAAELVDTGIAFTLINYPLVKTPMSSATGIYRNMKMMEVEDAAQWMVTAVKKRPARIAPRVGQAWATATAAAPGPTIHWTGKFMNRVAARLASRAGQK